MSKPYLSVVIPCFNEEKNLKRGVLEEVNDYLENQKYTSEVIVSDDGSTDGGKKIIKKFVALHPRFRLLENPHLGKPFAVKSGVMAAEGKIVLFTDMDQSTPINQLEKLLIFFQKGYDIVIGSRGQSRQGFPLFRRLASTIFRLARQALLLRNIVDTQCGFKAFRNEVAKDLFSRLLIFKKSKKVKGWRVGAFDVELLFIAQKRGYRIAEVPVEWQDKDIAQGKQRKFFKESWEMFKEILQVKLNDLRGFYK
ncbi:MAG: dolichyl-phosphate beta-glucosyltransferase [Microgenomates group bacterium]